MNPQLFLYLFVFAFSWLSIELNAHGQSYVFAYFQNNGEDGLHLAFSDDGYKWDVLNGNRSFLIPVVGSQKLMRDPCLIQGPDGMFHLVWTTGWRGTDIGIAHSKDLIHWTEQKALSVMADFPDSINCWAPEIVYDEKKKCYLIFWSTTIPGKFRETESSGDNGLNHRIYYTSTKDFKTYTKTKLFYDDSFNVIDGTIIKFEKRFAMIVKDETKNPVKKNLRIAFSDRIDGPFGKASEPFTQSWVEGPAAIKIGNEWVVYFDKYREKKYGAIKSRNLIQWEDVSEKLQFPEGVRHGTVFRVSKKILQRLKDTKLPK